MINIAITSKVITSTNTIRHAINVQPSNRDYVIVIKYIITFGWSLLLFLILARKLHQASQYHDLPTDQVVALSDNGQTTNQLGFEQLKHFNRYIWSCTIGAYRLLILGSYSSHATPKFDQYCIEHKIITLYMPPYTSYRLQLLNVGCFSPLKIAYGHEVRELAC